MKKLIYTLIVSIMVICIILFTMKNIDEKIDVINPLVKRGGSYAVVPSTNDAEHLSKQEIIDIQYYKDIESYDENGRKNNYLLDFKGYSPSEKYVKIDHKGKWVYFIEYISKSEYEKVTKQ